ncbi:hypothetical protein BC936DRAFT_143207, partial [Jimgerdemannia flammicorona]
MSGLSINTQQRQQQQEYHDDYDQGDQFGGQGNQDSSFDDDDDDGMSSSPSIPDENIDFDLVYALHTFVATVEGQASVVKGDALTLLDDSNSYWWLVKVLKTTEVGYIPAENIELTSQQNNQDVINRPPPRSIKKKKVYISKGVSFQSQVIITAETEEEDDEEEYEEWEEEMADDDDDYYDMDDDPLERVVRVVARDYERESVRGNSRDYDRDPRSSEENKTQLTVLRVFAGNVNLGATFKTVMVNPSTTAAELVKQAMLRFHIQEIEGGVMGESNSGVEYYVTVKGVDG